MRFSKSIVMYEFASMPFVGNPQNGYSLALTDEGSEICKKLMLEEVSEKEIVHVDENLFRHLEKGNFFDGPVSTKKISSMYLHVTQKCNLECVGCYSRDHYRNCLPDPSLENLKRATKIFADKGLASITISGGEPLLRSDLPELIRYIHEDIQIKNVSIITNGTIQEESLIFQLAPYVDRIAISIDGHSLSSHAYIRRNQRFDNIVDTIGIIKKAGIQAHIIPTIHQKNYREILDYVSLAKSLNVSINFSIFSSFDDSTEVEELLPREDMLQKLGAIMCSKGVSEGLEIRDSTLNMNILTKAMCGSCGAIVSVNADGEVYPCHMLHFSEFSLGNAFTDSYDEICNSKTRIRFGNLKASEFNICSDCRLVHLCGGGCRARSFFSTGRIRDKDPYCSMMKEYYQNFENLLVHVAGVEGGEK